MDLNDKTVFSPIQLAVVVATKNRSTLLSERSLAAIKQQTRKPDFLVVSDDSEQKYFDINREIVEGFSIPGCQIFHRQNHRSPGASGAWNSAIDHLLDTVETPEDVALAFLDDDDEWHPEYLERLLRQVQEKSLDMAACGIRRIEDSHAAAIENSAPEQLETSSFLVGNPGIQGSNLFLRLSAFLQAGGFDESLSSSTDRDLCLRLAEMQTIRYSPVSHTLVNHYAEADRIRLSTPSREEKQSGLTAFWQKYHSRMDSRQRQTFLQRAHDLFNWQLNSASDSHQQQGDTIKKAIVLLIDTELTREFLERLAEFYKHFRDIDLVGLDIVFPASDSNPAHRQHGQFLRDLGLGCFPVESQHLLNRYGAQISALRPGSRVWRCNGIFATHIKTYSDTQRYLLSCGAYLAIDSEEPSKALSSQEKAKTLKRIHELRVASAEHRITDAFQPKRLRVLGYGSEAIVFTDESTVFKCIDYWKTRTPQAQLKFLRANGPTWKNIAGLYPLDAVESDGVWILITYPYEASSPYRGGEETPLIQLMNDCTAAGIVCNNIHPNNLIQTSEAIKLIDYGSDIRPWNPLGFEHMARRAYLTCWYADRYDLKTSMRKSLTNEGLAELEGYTEFRAKLDQPIDYPMAYQSTMAPAPKADPFDLSIGVISADPLMLLPLISSLRVLNDHASIRSLTVTVLCNGCNATDLGQLLKASHWILPQLNIISECQQRQDAAAGYFGPALKHRAGGQLSIASARTMLQRYVGRQLESSPGSIAWILDDDMRLDKRACDYIPWLAIFRDQGVDVLIGAYEGSSPNPPLNGMRVQLMDLVHNLAWLAPLPEASILPDRSSENDEVRAKYPDYYYDLSRKHTAHLESPLWLERSYNYETVKEARARLITGAIGIINGTPLTRAIVAPNCQTPLLEAKNSVNRGGNTFIFNAKAITETPNLAPLLNGEETRRSDMIWAIVNRYYRGMTIKAIAFPVNHVGRYSDRPSLNSKKVHGEIIGAALYAGLTAFLQDNPQHPLDFTFEEIHTIYKNTGSQMNKRLADLQQSFYRIQGLTHCLENSGYSDELVTLIDTLKKEFSLTAYSDIKASVQQIGECDLTTFLDQLIPLTDAFSKNLNNVKPEHTIDGNQLDNDIKNTGQQS